MKTPALSVILPCYNASEYLAPAIQSILDQTYKSFELIIIDDGSTDNSPEIIRSFHDKRIKLVANEKNSGLVKTLNRGIETASAELIARMDADDISRPDRFAKQVSFLEKNPAVGVCSSWMFMIHNQKINKHRYHSSPMIEASLLFTNPIVHPSVVMRRNILPPKEAYSAAYPHGEDYALWISLIGKTKFEVLTDPLIEYRAHAGQVSRNYNEVQRASVGKAHEKLFEAMGIHATSEEKKLHISLFREEYQQSESYLDAVESWLKKLIGANEKKQVFDKKALLNVTGEWWFRVNRELAPAGIGSYSRFKLSSAAGNYILTPAAIAKLRVKAILKQSRKKQA